MNLTVGLGACKRAVRVLALQHHSQTLECLAVDQVLRFCLAERNARSHDRATDWLRPDWRGPPFQNGVPDSQPLSKPLPRRRHLNAGVPSALSNTDLTSILFLPLLLVGLAHLLGSLFAKLRQPRVIGEILAGVGRFRTCLDRSVASCREVAGSMNHQGPILNFVYWLGLLLLMFLSGAETQKLFSRDERREVGWLVCFGTGIPFLLGLALGPWLTRPSLAGPLSWQSRLTDYHFTVALR